MKVIVAAAIVFVAMVIAGRIHAQEEHVHGVDVPDWYDHNCCNLKDCKPVADEEITFLDNLQGEPLVVFRRGPLRIEFDKTRWRVSKDERYHVCNAGIIPYCVYLRGGV